VDGRWGPVHRRAAVLVGIDNVEERVAKDGLDGCERLLAGSWLAPEDLPPLGSSLLDREVEVIAEHTHGPKVALTGCRFALVRRS